MPAPITKELFFSRLRPTDSGCLEWTGSKVFGYGRTTRKGKGISAHRLAYVFAHGNIPAGLLVCHRCDNRACCNPEHLFLGTHSDNTRDCVNKGRWHRPAHPNSHYIANPPRGERNTNAKLTADKVRQIRQLYESGHYSQAKLSEMFGVVQTQISRVVRGAHWPCATS